MFTMFNTVPRQYRRALIRTMNCLIKDKINTFSTNTK